MNSISRIPPSALVLSLSYLDAREQNNTSKVCHTWRNIFNNDNLWADSFLEYYQKTYKGTYPLYQRVEPSSWGREYHAYLDWRRTLYFGHNMNRVAVEMLPLIFHATSLIRTDNNLPSHVAMDAVGWTAIKIMIEIAETSSHQQMEFNSLWSMFINKLKENRQMLGALFCTELALAYFDSLSPLTRSDIALPLVGTSMSLLASRLMPYIGNFKPIQSRITCAMLGALPALIYQPKVSSVMGGSCAGLIMAEAGKASMSDPFFYDIKKQAIVFATVLGATKANGINTLQLSIFATILIASANKIFLQKQIKRSGLKDVSFALTIQGISSVRLLRQLDRLDAVASTLMSLIKDVHPSCESDYSRCCGRVVTQITPRKLRQMKRNCFSRLRTTLNLASSASQSLSSQLNQRSQSYLLNITFRVTLTYVSLRQSISDHLGWIF